MVMNEGGGKGMGDRVNKDCAWSVDRGQSSL